MKNKYLLLLVGLLMLLAIFAFAADNRPFYRQFTVTGSTNATHVLSITNTFTPGYASDELIQQKPTIAAFKFGYTQATTTLAVARTARGVSFSDTNTSVIAASQGTLILGHWVYSTGDVMAITFTPCPTNDTTVEITYE